MRTGPPKCLNINKGNVTVVHNNFCNFAKRPTYQEKTCNEFKCPKVWIVTSWSECSQTCGVGRKKRDVTCSVQLPDGKWENRTNSECSVSAKPITTKTCVQKACFLQWRTTAWSKCRGLCGATGVKTRSVTCPKKNSCRNNLKPVAKKRCRKEACDFKWNAGPWKKCSKTCGLGYASRSIVCRDERTFRVYHNSKCKGKNRPPKRKRCALRPCPVKKAPGYTLQTVDLHALRMRTPPYRARNPSGRTRGATRMLDARPPRMMEPRRPRKRSRTRYSRRRQIKRRQPTRRSSTRRLPSRRTTSRRLPIRRLPLKTAPVRRLAAKPLPIRRLPLKSIPISQLPAKAAPARRVSERPKTPTSRQQRQRVWRQPTYKVRPGPKPIRGPLSTKLHKMTNPLTVKLSVSKPKEPEECKDTMPAWACDIHIMIAEAANKRFCEDDQGRKCCKTCRNRKILAEKGYKSKRPFGRPTFRYPAFPRLPRGRYPIRPKVPSS